MNDQTIKLLRDLADKLGTTSEHLWGVLVRQAPISAITSLILFVGFCGFLVWSFGFIKNKTTDQIVGEQRTRAEWDSEGVGIPAWIIWGLMFVLGVGFSFPICYDAICALFNPEYWALKQIIK
jgi:hypothetical protein